MTCTADTYFCCRSHCAEQTLPLNGNTDYTADRRYLFKYLVEGGTVKNPTQIHALGFEIKSNITKILDFNDFNHPVYSAMELFISFVHPYDPTTHNKTLSRMI